MRGRLSDFAHHRYFVFFLRDGDGVATHQGHIVLASRHIAVLSQNGFQIEHHAPGGFCIAQQIHHRLGNIRAFLRTAHLIGAFEERGFHLALDAIRQFLEMRFFLLREFYAGKYGAVRKSDLGEPPGTLDDATQRLTPGDRVIAWVTYFSR